jgi:t-SNARE complex subunit (syntaxin)
MSRQTERSLSLSSDNERSTMTDGHPAPQVTIDALLYSFRSGTAVLARVDVQERLSRICEKQMREICTLLRNRNPKVARSWTADEIEKLIIAWATCHD